MKKRFVLYLAGMLVLCSGCQKIGYGRGAISFAATAPSGLDTKAEWGGDVGEESEGVQRIVWKNGDQITLKSTLARTAEGLDSFTYTVSNADPKENGNPRYSYGKLTPAGSDGLLWDENYLKQEHEFWAAYPNLPIGSGGSFSATVPDDGLVMVAHVDGAVLSSKEERDAAAKLYTARNAAGGTITLYFYPAFTTVKIKLENKTGEQISINSVTLSHETMALQGSYSANITNTGVSGCSTGSAIKSVSLNLGATLADQTEMSAYSAPFYLLPRDISNVRLTVNYTRSGKAVEKSMTIDRTFQAGQQYRLKGLVLEEELQLIDFQVITMGQDFENINLGNTTWE